MQSGISSQTPQRNVQPLLPASSNQHEIAGNRIASCSIGVIFDQAGGNSTN
jgi:hypothetical protein